MTDVLTVRLLINDTAAVGAGQIFADEDIQTFLDLEGDVKLAAAQALDTIATNEALVLKRIRTLDLNTDGPAVAKALRDHAEVLRKQVDGDAGGEFAISDVTCEAELAERRRLLWPEVCW